LLIVESSRQPKCRESRISYNCRANLKECGEVRRPRGKSRIVVKESCGRPGIRRRDLQVQSAYLGGS